MNFMFSAELLIGTFAGLVTAMIVLLALQVRNSIAVNRLAAPVYDYVLHEAAAEAKQIVDQAKREATHIRDEAEAERAVLIATYTDHIHSLHQTFTEQLTAHTAKMEKTIDVSFQKTVDGWHTAGMELHARMSAAEKNVKERFATLETSLADTEATLAKRADQAMETFEHDLTATVTVMKEKLQAYDTAVTSHVDTHTKDALKAIDDALLAYRTARERILDTHMAQIIEAVATDVLHKQLTLTDHAELAQQALIEAKQRHIL